MNINDVTARKEYVGNGSTTIFAYDFGIVSTSDIEVIVNGVTQTLGTHYSVSGAGSDFGGDVTFVIAPSNAINIILLRKQPFSQLSVYQANEDFPAKRLETDLSKEMMATQQIREILARVPTVSRTSLLKNFIFPEGVIGKLLRWKTTTEVENVDSTVFVPGAITIPLSTNNGGTSGSYTSTQALARGLGLALWGGAVGAVNITPSGNTVSLPDPLTTNFFTINAVNFSTISVGGQLRVGSTIIFFYLGVMTLTSGGGMRLIGDVPYTTVTGDISIFSYNGTLWVEILRLPVTTGPTKFWRGDGTWQTIPVPTGLAGLTISNNGADATNDIDMAIGSCISDDADPLNKVSMYLSSILTKRLDAAWTVGNNQGGLDTGSIGNGTYHIYVIKRPDTGVVDWIFSLSATAPTMPTNYTKKQRVGSILRESATIVPFDQFGDVFQRVTPILDFDNATPGTSAITVTLSVPTGIRVWARVNLWSTNTGFSYLSSLSVTDQAASNTVAPLASTGSNGENFTGPVEILTNASAQIRQRNGANIATKIATLGWVDPTRGKN